MVKIPGNTQLANTVKQKIGTGELAPWLRAPVAQFPTHDDSQPSVTPIPGDLMTSSDLHRYGQADKIPEHIKEVNLFCRERETKTKRERRRQKLDKALISKRD